MDWHIIATLVGLVVSVGFIAASAYGFGHARGYKERDAELRDYVARSGSWAESEEDGLGDFDRYVGRSVCDAAIGADDDG